MRYLRDFNDWHGRDVEDRHAEIRGLNARIDQIRDMTWALLTDWQVSPIVEPEIRTLVGFAADRIGPVNALWSVIMLSGLTQLLVWTFVSNYAGIVRLRLPPSLPFPFMPC